jgi:uncharacterized RDD family membrane protein YckC
LKEKEITIETPEKITFSYTVSEIGTRMAACFIDMLIQAAIVLFFILLIILAGFPLLKLTDIDAASISPYVIAFYFILTFFLQWFYYIFFEVKMEGQSPGKKAMRIRVIKPDGGHLDFETIVLRNLLRAVDAFTFIPLVGGFVAVIDKLHRRLGDIIADTIVVNEIYFNLQKPSFSASFYHQNAAKVGEIAIKLDEEELYILRRFLNERYKLTVKKQQEIAMNLANQVREKLKISDQINDPLLFLESIYKHHGS